jgi:hypothetical protein
VLPIESGLDAPASSSMDNPKHSLPRSLQNSKLQTTNSETWEKESWDSQESCWTRSPMTEISPKISSMILRSGDNSKISLKFPQQVLTNTPDSSPCRDLNLLVSFH